MGVRIKYGWVKSHYIKKGGNGAWSKYGGGRITNESHPKTWVCQVCGREQWVLPQFLFPFDKELGEFVRICASCKHRSYINKTSTFDELLELTKKSYWFDVANLVTLPLR